MQRSLCLEEVIDDSSSTRVEFPSGVGNKPETRRNAVWPRGKTAGARAKRRSRARKEVSAQEVRGYYKQFAEAKHLEWKSWIDSEVFDLVELTEVKPKNYVTGRWVPTIKTVKQLPQGKG